MQVWGRLGRTDRMTATVKPILSSNSRYQESRWLIMCLSLEVTIPHRIHPVNVCDAGGWRREKTLTDDLICDPTSTFEENETGHLVCFENPRLVYNPASSYTGMKRMSSSVCVYAKQSNCFMYICVVRVSVMRSTHKSNWAKAKTSCLNINWVNV